METLFIYLKSSGLVTLFFLAYYFHYEETFSPVTVGFVGRFGHTFLPLLVSRNRLGGTNPATIDWSQIPVGIPVEKTLRWIGFDCRNDLCPGNSRFFNPIWIGLLQLKQSV
jgi:hypothetical protein